MLKVFFTASTSFGGQLINQYKNIIDLIYKNKAKLTSGKQIIEPKLLELDKNLSKDKIFRRETKLIEDSDCIIAEVTKPSLGVGSEIAHALIKNKPVLALVLENNEDKLSPMIKGNPSTNLFLENYNLDNVKFVIKNFLSYILTSKQKKGKLIVIDGGDGSGKSTQSKLLLNYFKTLQIATKFLHFPRYANSFHGKVIAKFLRGEFGDLNAVSPYLISLTYALDRSSVKEEIEDFLKKGGYIICDRYVTSSLAHQAAKVKNKKSREEFLEWLFQLEYKMHRMPKEDIVIHLFVPWKIGMSLTEKIGRRDYLKNVKMDIAEKSVEHRISSEKMYLELSKRYKHWVKIDCFENGKLLPPELIHKKIIQVLKDRHII